MIDVRLRIDDARLIRGFKDFEKSNAIATRRTLNIAAANTRKRGQANIKKNFTLRNKFTHSQVQYTQVPEHITNIQLMRSSAGATQKAAYLKAQEEGTKHYQRVKKPKTAIALRSARVGKSDAKLVDKDMYMSKIKKNIIKSSARAKGTRKSKFIAKAFMAHKLSTPDKPKFVYRKHNVFMVRSITKTGRNSVNMNLEHIYTIKPPPDIKKKEWLMPAARRSGAEMRDIYIGQMKRLQKKE